MQPGWWRQPRNIAILIFCQNSSEIMGSVFRCSSLWKYEVFLFWNYSFSSSCLLFIAKLSHHYACTHLTHLPLVPHIDTLTNGVGIDLKRKPPCIGGMELVSLSCNRVFVSAESYGLGWCKIAIATKWYQFHTTDKCGFLFMPWMTDQLYICAIHKTGQ